MYIIIIIMTIPQLHFVSGEAGSGLGFGYIYIIIS